MIYYTVYKITNLINGKIYIGAHKTSNLDDGYMGSGTYIKRAQKKYGIENFEKEILEVFETSEEMFEMESKLVTKGFIKDDSNYNLKEGGYGGFDYLNNDFEIMSARGKLAGAKNVESGQIKIAFKRLKWLRENDLIWIEKNNIAISKGLKTFYENGGIAGFKDRIHTDTTKKKIGNATSKIQKGEGNSQFGTMWIHNLEEKISKKIKKDEFSDWEAKGWLKGRKINFDKKCVECEECKRYFEQKLNEKFCSITCKNMKKNLKNEKREELFLKLFRIHKTANKTLIAMGFKTGNVGDRCKWTKEIMIKHNL